jgi:hypothetical protein
LRLARTADLSTMMPAPPPVLAPLLLTPPAAPIGSSGSGHRHAPANLPDSQFDQLKTELQTAVDAFALETGLFTPEQVKEPGGSFHLLARRKCGDQPIAPK